jgi:hypothetical protein
MKRHVISVLLAAAVAATTHIILNAQSTVGNNVNVITGVSDQFIGDMFRQRQNEPVIGISSLNPNHMMAAYNDYRTVDFAADQGVGTTGPIQRTLFAKLFHLFRQPERDRDLLEEADAGQAWIGLSFSDNGGADWYTGLHPGNPFGTSAEDIASPLFGYEAASDPVIASIHNQFFLAGIAFTPNGGSSGFVSRFTDQNRSERGQNIHFDFTRKTLTVPDATQFVDKPSIAAGPNGHVYVAYVLFDPADPAKLASKIVFFRSVDFGNSWDAGTVVSQPLSRNQSPWVVVDPNNETTVYIGWRVFSNPQFPNLTNAIVGRKSTNGGVSFDPIVPYPVALLLKAFDSPQVKLNLTGSPATLPTPRSNAYPSAAIAGNGGIHVVMQEWVNPSTGFPLGPTAPTSNGVPRITMTSSYNGGVTWTLRKAIDLGVGSGTQFMPVIATVGEAGPVCNGGPRTRIVVMYYDARASGTNSYVVGGGTQFDVRIAEASSCNLDQAGRPIFGPSQQMSRYSINPATKQIVTTPGFGYKAVNRALEMFCGGFCSFTGDYIHLIPRVPYVNTGTAWKLTTANGVPQDKLPSPVLQGVWGDMRDAVFPTSPLPLFPPSDPKFVDGLAWSNYQPPGTGLLPGACQNPGARDQNVYTAEYSVGSLFAAAPVTFRPSNGPHAYPLYVENRAGVKRFFRLTIDPTATATFNVPGQGPDDKTADIGLGAYSTVTGSIVVGANTTTPVSIAIAQITAIGGTLVPNGAATAVTLNTSGDSTTQTETHQPVVQATPVVTKPFADAGIGLPATVSPTSPLPSPFTDNPFTDNPFTDNPFTDNKTVYDITDVSFAVTNDGNAAAAFAALSNVRSSLKTSGSYVFQVFINRIARNTKLNDCQPVETPRDVQISSIKTPFTDNPFTDNPFTDNPFTDNPFTDNAAPGENVSNSTFYLAPPIVPGESAALRKDTEQRLARRTPDGKGQIKLASLQAAAVAQPPFDTWRADRPADKVIYTLRAYQVRQAGDPLFVPLNPATDVGLTVKSETPNIIQNGAVFVFDPAGPKTSTGGAAVPVKVAFVRQPTSTTVGQAITPAVTVAIQDAFGTTLTTSTLPVTLALGNNPSNAMLSGTLTNNAVNGIATFSDLRLDQVGTAYTLVASSPSLAPATSAPFDVTRLVITTLALPDGTQGLPYSQAVFAQGGAPPYTWDVKPVPGDTTGQFTLPNGLTVSTDEDGTTGRISGTPTTVQVRSFRLRVTDSAGHTATQDLCIHIAAPETGTLTANPSTADVAAQTLAGAGVTISNVTYAGATAAIGTFSGGLNSIGLGSGIILSSGGVNSIKPPNSSPNFSTANAQPGDLDLDALIPNHNTVDRAALEFDFRVDDPNATVLKFDYVFASEEYNEFANTNFNDVFAFFISGPDLPKANFALIPGTTTPVSINTINIGNSNPTGDHTPHHPELFVNNDYPTGTFGTEADGFTKVLTIQAIVTPGATYHMKIAIADAGDANLNSWVLLKSHSLTVVCPIIPSCVTCGL